MSNYKENYQEDYFHNAAKALKDCFGLGMAQAHDLTAASLGYMSKKAALDDWVDPYSQWLHCKKSDLKTMSSVVNRMSGVDREYLIRNIEIVSRVIRDGLAPACVESRDSSRYNIPLGNPKEGDDCDWINPDIVRDEYSDYAFCDVCGDHTAYHVDDLYRDGLCPEHHGEYDRDDEEQADLESYIEYHTKD